MPRLERRNLLKTVGVSAGMALGVGGTAADFESADVEQTQSQSFTATVVGGFLATNESSSPGSDQKTVLFTQDKPGTIEGEIYGDGTWESTSVSFPQITESGSGVTITVDEYCQGTIQGTIDRENGVMTGDVPFRADITMDYSLGTENGLIEADAEDSTTEQSGSMTGSASGLDTQSATVTLVDNEFTVPSSGNEIIDDPETFDLPSNTPGNNWFQMEMELDLPPMPTPTGTLTGTVTGDGNAVSQATVSFLQSGSEVDSTTTGANGEYSIELDAGTYDVEVNHENFAAYSDTIAVVGDETRTESFELPPLPGTVTGSVTDGGSPLSAVPVAFYPAGADEVAQLTSTDDQGDYDVSLDPGTYDVTAGGQEYGQIERTDIEVVSDETTSLDPIVLGELDLTTVTGTVTDENGDAVVDVEIEFVGQGTSGATETVTSGTAGEYSIDLAAGTYDVVVEDERFLNDTEPDQSIEGATMTVNVVLQGPPILGTGRPRDIDGDGTFEDVDGSGEFDIFDVQFLFKNMDSPEIQNNQEYFKFSDGDGSIGVFDVQALFNKL